MKIERGDDPGPFSQPRDYVRDLRTLFRCRCAYCLTPDDRLGGEEGMRVDHFLPQSRFPGRRLAWSNLYYSCDVCNNRKSNHPTEEEETQGLRFVDPCKEDPDDHFRMVRDPETGDFCRIAHCSDAAKYTIRRLQFNRRKFLRDFWRDIDAVETIWTDRISVVERLQTQLGEPDAESQQLLVEFNSELAAVRELRPFPLSESAGPTSPIVDS